MAAAAFSTVTRANAGLIRYKVTWSDDTLTLTSGGTSATYRRH
jgi:hypothetical protein